MKAAELRKKYLDFFASKGHAVIPSASLIPENDPTVLFTTAGMHPLVPYLLGEKHPAGARLTSVQKCIRTGDIEEVGDAVHLTFFEMLGNWSLGEYWKQEAIEMSFEFLTKELKFPVEKLAVSVFAGDDDASFDEESFDIWKGLGISEKRIAKLGKKDNWWGPAGQTGPCGPDSEMFYWIGEGDAPENFQETCEDSAWVEVWNDVFMQYEKTAEGKFIPLKQQNVDTGMGLDRVAAILQGKATVFETDLFEPIMAKIHELASSADERSERIVADHLRAAVFIIGDARGVTPSNTDAGYIVRRLIRRAIREARKLGFDFTQTFTTQIAEEVIKNFGEAYPELVQNSAKVLLELEKEENQFKKTLEKGINYLKKIFGKCIGGVDPENLPPGMNLEGNKMRINGKEVFRVYETYGIPPELSQEIMSEWGIAFDDVTMKECEEAMKLHSEQSRTASAGKFAGGLADDSEAVAQLHTATHLLHAALRKVLGEHVEQRGSNITADRLRFDFSHGEKLTPEQKEEVTKLVNEAIEQKLPVSCEEMSVDEAKAAGAMGIFDDKYGEKVKVFSVGDVSKEICGGPHAGNTSELGKFKIKKEESSSAGVRRIKAVLLKDE
jgi:alanyl-tRNA synthetase